MSVADKIMMKADQTIPCKKHMGKLCTRNYTYHWLDKLLSVLRLW